MTRVAAIGRSLRRSEGRREEEEEDGAAAPSPRAAPLLLLPSSSCPLPIHTYIHILSADGLVALTLDLTIWIRVSCHTALSIAVRGVKTYNLPMRKHPLYLYLLNRFLCEVDGEILDIRPLFISVSVMKRMLHISMKNWKCYKFIRPTSS